MNHPSPEQLELFALGAIEGHQLVTIKAHLDTCAACCQRAIAETRLEDALEQVAESCRFCVACDRLSDDDRCAYCGAALQVAGYRIVAVVVQNARGRLYLAVDADGREVALKELCFHQPPSAGTQESFEREARFLRALANPRLPRFVASFTEGAGNQARLYLAQEYVAGENLEQRMVGHYFDEPEIIDIADQALEVLVYLQQLSPMVFHRDVKPANLIRRPDGTIVLVDFGAARDDATTAGSTQVGTFGYMPIEQLGGIVDATTDGFALGASLLHLLTRRPPWQLLDGPLPQLNVSPALRRFLMRLTERRPEDRFPSARAAQLALRQLGERRPRSRARVLAVIAGATVAFGAGGLGAWKLTHHREPAIASDHVAPMSYPSQLATPPVRQGVVTQPMPMPMPMPPRPRAKAPLAETPPPPLCRGGSCSLWVNVAPYALNSGWLQPQVSSKQLTVEAWFKAAPNIQIDWPHAITLTLSNGELHGMIDRREISGRVPGDEDAWHHVAISYDGTIAKLYADGEELAERPCISECATPSLMWGVSFSGTGYIDELQVWSSARSQAEIRADRKRKPALDEPNLIGFFHFDGAATIAPLDATGRNGPFQLNDRSSQVQPFVRVAEAAPTGE